MLYSIGILKNKQSELIDEMTDSAKTAIEKLSYTMMYDDLRYAIAILEKAFFERNT